LGCCPKPHYTRRLTRLSDPPDPNDFILLCDGVDVGRCKLEMMAGAVPKWTWTIYIAGPGRPCRSAEGIPIVGAADTLERAQHDFKAAFERVRVAGLIDPFAHPPA
jgi:hypothetical protein